MSNSLDSDQAHYFVEPDLAPNYLHMLSADDTSRRRVKKSMLEDSNANFLLTFSNVAFSPARNVRHHSP